MFAERNNKNLAPLIFIGRIVRERKALIDGALLRKPLARRPVTHGKHTRRALWLLTEVPPMQRGGDDAVAQKKEKPFSFRLTQHRGGVLCVLCVCATA